MQADKSSTRGAHAHKPHAWPLQPGWREVVVTQNDTIETLYKKGYAPNEVQGGERQLALWLVAYHGNLPTAGERLRLPPLDVLTQQAAAGLARLPYERSVAVQARANELVKDGITQSAHREVRQEVNAVRAALTSKQVSLPTPVAAPRVPIATEVLGASRAQMVKTLGRILAESAASFHHANTLSRVTWSTWLGNDGELHSSDWRPLLASYKTLAELEVEVTRLVRAVDPDASSAAVDVVMKALVASTVDQALFTPVTTALSAELDDAVTRLEVFARVDGFADRTARLLLSLNPTAAVQTLQSYGLLDDALLEALRANSASGSRATQVAALATQLRDLANTRLNALAAVQRDMTLLWNAPEARLHWAPAFTSRVIQTAALGLDAAVFPFTGVAPSNAAQEVIVQACEGHELGGAVGLTSLKAITAFAAEAAAKVVGHAADVTVNAFEASMRGYRAAILSRALAAAGIGEDHSLSRSIIKALGAEAAGFVTGVFFHAYAPRWEQVLGGSVPGATQEIADELLTAFVDKAFVLGVELGLERTERQAKAEWLDHRRAMAEALLAPVLPALRRQFETSFRGDSREFTAVLALFASLYGERVQALMRASELEQAFRAFAAPVMIQARAERRE